MARIFILRDGDRMIEQIQHDALVRAGYRCEHEYRYDGKAIRCPEIHGELAKTFKGKVILVPHEINKKNGFILRNLKMVCWKHGNDLDCKKKKYKPRPKKVDLLQGNIFEKQLNLGV